MKRKNSLAHTLGWSAVIFSCWITATNTLQVFGDSFEEGSQRSPQVIGARSLFLVGHSLVNFDMPSMLNGIARSLGKVHSYGQQIINGATLSSNWKNGDRAQGVNAREAIPGGGYDALVITEAVPLDNHLRRSNTDQYARLFYELAVGANPSAEVFLYETWHCVDSGTGVGCPYDSGDDVDWRERLRRDLGKWQGIVDRVNAGGGGRPMRLIPAGQALGRLVDEVEAGRVPGLSSRRDLFADHIHLNDVGNYFVALVHYAVLYGADPSGAAEQTSNTWGTPFTPPPPGSAEALQRIAWEVAGAYRSANNLRE